MEHHLPYKITQCYLSPNNGECPHPYTGLFLKIGTAPPKLLEIHGVIRSTGIVLHC